MTLAERAQAVQTREDLVAFIKALQADHGTNRNGWEIANLESFLSAMAAWTEDMEGFYSNMGQDISKMPPWKILADILMAARIYE